MITLKVIWNDQIRRVGFEPASNGSFASLHAKLAELLNLQGKPFTIRCGDALTMQLVDSDATLNPVIDAMTKTSPWPILRVLVEETSSQPTTVLDSLLVNHKPNEEKEAKDNHKPHTQQAEVTCDTCSACNVFLGAAYYKCLNCLNVVLCEACEEKNAHSGHLLVKLRCAVSSLPLKYQMVFLDHIADPQERQTARNQKLVLRECCEKEVAEKKAAQAKKRQDEKEARQKERLQAKELKKEQQRLKAKEAKMMKASEQQQKKAKKQSSTEKLAAKKKRATKQLVVAKKKTSSKAEPAPAAEVIVVAEAPSPATILTHDETVSTVSGASTESAITQESQLQLSDFHVIPDVAAAIPVVTVVSNDEPVSKVVVAAAANNIDCATSSVVSNDVEPEPAVSVMSEESVTPPDAVVATPSAAATRKPNPFVQNLERLAEMGFTDKEKNIRLLVKHVGDLDATVEELLRTKTSWFW